MIEDEGGGKRGSRWRRRMSEEGGWAGGGPAPLAPGAKIEDDDGDGVNGEGLLAGETLAPGAMIGLEKKR